MEMLVARRPAEEDVTSPPSPQSGRPAPVRAVKPHQEPRFKNNDLRPWSGEDILKRVSPMFVEGKGRTLFMSTSCPEGSVVLVEKPCAQLSKRKLPQLWERIHKLNDEEKLLLGPQVMCCAAMSLVLEKDARTKLDEKCVAPPDDPIHAHALRDSRRVLANLLEVGTKGRGAKPTKGRPMAMGLEAFVSEIRERRITAEELRTLALVWFLNAYEMPGSSPGLVLYDQCCLLAHSCEPNCDWQYGPSHAFVLYARTKVEPMQELSISYLGDEHLRLPTAGRQKLLREHWGFHCRCAACGGGGRAAPATSFRRAVAAP